MDRSLTRHRHAFILPRAWYLSHTCGATLCVASALVNTTTRFAHGQPVKDLEAIIRGPLPQPRIPLRVRRVLDQVSVVVLRTIAPPHWAALS